MCDCTKNRTTTFRNTTLPAYNKNAPAMEQRAWWDTVLQIITKPPAVQTITPPRPNLPKQDNTILYIFGGIALIVVLGIGYYAFSKK